MTKKEKFQQGALYDAAWYARRDDLGGDIGTILDRARAEFPLEFHYQYYKGDGSPGKMVKKKKGSLLTHRANASIDENKLFDWYLKWFGSE